MKDDVKNSVLSEIIIRAEKGNFHIAFSEDSLEGEWIKNQELLFIKRGFSISLINNQVVVDWDRKQHPLVFEPTSELTAQKAYLNARYAQKKEGFIRELKRVSETGKELIIKEGEDPDMFYICQEEKDVLIVPKGYSFRKKRDIITISY